MSDDRSQNVETEFEPASNVDPNINSPEIEYDVQNTLNSSNNNIPITYDGSSVTFNNETVSSSAKEPERRKPKVPVIRSRRERVVKPRQMWSPS